MNTVIVRLNVCVALVGMLALCGRAEFMQPFPSEVQVRATGGETVEYAAGELARLLGRVRVKASVRMLGTNGNAVAIGAFRRADLSEVRHDGFVIDCRTDGVTVSANCGKGVLNGIYELAEELGFAFVFPTPDGELVPERLAPLSTGVRTVNPCFAHRGLFDSSDKGVFYDYSSWMEFLAKLRFNSIANHASGNADDMKLLDKLGFRREYGGHGMSSCLPRDLFKTRPELFRMFQPEDFGGKRQPDANFCVCNPETQRIVASNFVKKAGKYADAGYYAFHAWADDLPGGGWCMCPSCRSLEPSDQAQLAMNVEARAVRENGYRLRVPAIAYHDTMFPSMTIDPDPLCFLLFAPRERCYAHSIGDPDCARNVSYLKALGAWTKRYARNGDAHTFEYYNDKILFRGHTPYLPEVVVRDADVYERHGIDSFMSLQVGGPLLAPDWNLLAFARSGWKPGLGRDGMTAELLRGFPAADREVWRRCLDMQADAYSSALAVCELPDSIYFDYRFMPERGGEYGLKLIANIDVGAKRLRAAKGLLESAGLGDASRRLAGLEVKRLAFESADFEAMAEHQRGLYALAEWRNGKGDGLLAEARSRLEKAIALLDRAYDEVKPLVCRPGESEEAVGFGTCYYLSFVRKWSQREIRGKLDVYKDSEGLK